MNKLQEKKAKFAFAKSLQSLKSTFKGENQPKTFAQMSSSHKKHVDKKWQGPLGEKYRKLLLKTVKPGKGKFALPSQEPGSVKPPTIKPPGNTKKVTQKVGGNKSRWLTHVGEFKAKNPGMAYKEVLIEAKKTYETNRKVKRAVPKPKIEKQVGVVKDLPAPAKKEPKARKLNQKQMKQRWNRVKTEEGQTGEGFEDFYEKMIKGKRFANNEEIEQLIIKFAGTAKIDKQKEEDVAKAEKAEIEKAEKEKREAMTDEEIALEKKKREDQIKKNDEENEKRRAAEEKAKKKAADESWENAKQMGAALEKKKKAEKSDKGEMKEGDDHFESGKGKVFSEVKGLGLDVVPYYYVPYWEKSDEGMDILRKLERYRNKTNNKNNSKYLAVERDYYLFLLAYEWNDFTELPDDEQTEARDKYLRQQKNIIKRDYKEKRSKAKDK